MKQVIIGGYYDLLNVSDAEYSCLMGGYLWGSDPDVKAQVISTAGTIRNLRVKLNDVPGTGTYTFTLHRAVGLGAWADTALTCTVAADGTLASDTVNEVAVAAGDVVCLKCAPSSPDNARYARWTVEFEGDTANESLFLATGACIASASYYGVVQGWGYTVAEDDMRQVCPTSGKIKNLYAQLATDPGTAPDAYRITLRVNGANSDDGAGNPLQCTIVADNKTGNDTTHEITVSAGDILTILAEPISAPANTVDAAFGMTFVADTDGESLIMGGQPNDLDATATEYNSLTPYSAGWTATEAQRYQLAQACTLKKLYVLLSGSPSAGDKYTFTVRQNGASPGGGLVVEIAVDATTGNDTANTIAISDDDDVDLMVVPTSTPDIRDAYWGLVGYIEAAAGPVNVASVDGIAIANIAKIDGIAIANIAKLDGIA